MIHGYARVSTTQQANDGDSLDVQRRQIEGYCLMHGLTLDAMHIEEGVSGSMPINERPVGGALFASLKRGDVLIAAKLDRLFRSALDALTVVEDLKQRGVKLHLLDLGGDIAGNGLSKLFLTIAAAFAEAERDRIRERVADGMRAKRAKGGYLGGVRPFGYEVVGEGKDAVLRPLEAEQTALAAMREMRAAGASLRAISAAMAERGVRISHEGVAKALARG